VRNIAAPPKEVETVSIKIIIAAHKKYWMPTDPVYLPVHVGAEGKFQDAQHPADSE